MKVTTLPNKIRVATEHTPGHFAALGLYVDAGSRYEKPSTSGVSHFLDRMAFKVRAFNVSPGAWYPHSLPLLVDDQNSLGRRYGGRH